jgi:hypothetical protein
VSYTLGSTFAFELHPWFQRCLGSGCHGNDCIGKRVFILIKIRTQDVMVMIEMATGFLF